MIAKFVSKTCDETSMVVFLKLSLATKCTHTYHLSQHCTICMYMYLSTWVLTNETYHSMSCTCTIYKQLMKQIRLLEGWIVTCFYMYVVNMGPMRPSIYTIMHNQNKCILFSRMYDIICKHFQITICQIDKASLKHKLHI